MLVDLILLLVIAVAVFIGWKRGLVMSIFLFGTTIVAIILASVLAPVVSTGIEKLGVADAIAPKFSSMVEAELLEEYKEHGEADVEEATKKLPLPSFLKDKLSATVDKKAEESIDKMSVTIGAKAASLACVVIAFVVVFVLVLLLMQVIKGLLKFVVKIPVVKQIDKFAGIVVGFAQGAMFVLVFLLFVSALSSLGILPGLVSAVENSTITGFLYESNIIGKIISALA